MFVNFKDVFKEDNYKIPKEIIEALNENAPEGLEYKQCDNDICVLVGENLNIKLEFEKPEGFTGKTSKESVAAKPTSRFCKRKKRVLRR